MERGLELSHLLLPDALLIASEASACLVAVSPCTTFSILPLLIAKLILQPHRHAARVMLLGLPDLTPEFRIVTRF